MVIVLIVAEYMLPIIVLLNDVYLNEHCQAICIVNFFLKDDDRDFEEIEKELKRKAQSERDRGRDHRRNEVKTII
jgi:hypothetical protein